MMKSDVSACIRQVAKDIRGAMRASGGDAASPAVRNLVDKVAPVDSGVR
jgi:hypothetical protein